MPPQIPQTAPIGASSVQIRVKIPGAWDVALRDAAREQGQSVSALVRFSLRQFLAGRLA